MQSNVDCRMQAKMATEVKKPNNKSTSEELAEKEERELALLIELAKVYYDGP
jgi:hypothetical protein